MLYYCIFAKKSNNKYCVECILDYNKIKSDALQQDDPTLHKKSIKTHQTRDNNFMSTIVRLTLWICTTQSRITQIASAIKLI